MQRKQLAGVKIGMLAEIEESCEAAETPVSFDFGRGQIVLEADRLFGTGSWEITPEGQEYLQRFIDACAAVLANEAYAKFVSCIVIEGHTGIRETYSESKSLSADRADALAKYCANQNVDKEIRVAGCAYDYPVYNADGSVNEDESNRMVVRFLLAEK